MRSVSSSVVIRSRPEPVWQLMSEPARYPEYVTATQRVLSSSDEVVQVGTTYREYGGIPPFVGESEWRVTELDHMTHQHHDGDDGATRLLLDVDLEDVDEDATRLTLTIGIEPRWFLKVPMAVLWPLMMRRRAQQVMDETTANAKRLVEAELVA